LDSRLRERKNAPERREKLKWGKNDTIYQTIFDGGGGAWGGKKSRRFLKKGEGKKLGRGGLT